MSPLLHDSLRASILKAPGGRSPPPPARTPLRTIALKSFLDFAGLQAARANIRPLRLPVQKHADALEVRVEAALGGDHRVAPVVAEAGLLPTDCADLGHGRAV